MIRLAEEKDLKGLLEIFEKAKEYMRRTGNPHQWKEDYPGSGFLDEIRNNEVYVFEEDSNLYGCFRLHIGEDPTYSLIRDGAWLNDKKPYGTLHRVASDGSHRGLFGEMIKFSLNKMDQLRIDTHRDNLVMQKLLENHGFCYCGIIYLENGEERLAYQRI